MNSLKWEHEDSRIAYTENLQASDKFFEEKEVKLLKLDFKGGKTISGITEIQI